MHLVSSSSLTEVWRVGSSAPVGVLCLGSSAPIKNEKHMK